MFYITFQLIVTTVLFFNLGACCEWAVSDRPRPIYPQAKEMPK